MHERNLHRKEAGDWFHIMDRSPVGYLQERRTQISIDLPSWVADFTDPALSTLKLRSRNANRVLSDRHGISTATAFSSAFHDIILETHKRREVYSSDTTVATERPIRSDSSTGSRNGVVGQTIRIEHMAVPAFPYDIG